MGVDDGRRQIDHRGKTLISFSGTQSYAFEFFQFLEIVLNEVPPFVAVFVKFRREFPI